MASADFHSGDPHISYSDEDAPRVTQLFSFIWWLQLFSGQIPLLVVPKWLPSELQTAALWLARCYSVFVIWAALHLGLLFTKTTLDALPTGDLEDITDSLTMTVIYFFTAYATTYWCIRSRQLMQFYEHINLQYRHHSMAGVSFVSAHKAYRWSRNFTVAWVSACLVGVTFWGITPLVVGLHVLPLRCWYPFDPLVAGRYGWLYATQLYGQIIVGATFASGGALFVTLCLLMLAQFDVLYCSLKNLDCHARLLSGETSAGLSQLQRELLVDAASCELNEYVLLQEHATDLLVYTQQPARPLKVSLQAALVECVRLHQFILHCCAQLELMFSPYCLVKSLQITIQLCLLVFVGVSGSRETVRIINQLQYLALTLFELLMFTYCGELLRGHSVRAGDALWRSAWWRHAQDIRLDLLIFLVNSRKQVQVTAGKFYVMDVNRLRSVVTQAFSFLTLLQKLAAKKQQTDN